MFSLAAERTIQKFLSSTDYYSMLSKRITLAVLASNILAHQTTHSLHVIYKGTQSSNLQKFQGIANSVNKDPALINYKNNALQLRQLAADTWGCFIDTNCFIGAKHQLKSATTLKMPLTLGTTKVFAELTYSKRVDHPTQDISLLFFNSPVKSFKSLSRNQPIQQTITPVKIYSGGQLAGRDYYLYADMWHAAQGNPNGRAPWEGLFALCESPAIKSAIFGRTSRRTTFNLITKQVYPSLDVITYKGDSSCGVYKKVGNEFQLTGINVNCMGQSAEVEVVSDPTLHQWINKAQLKVALNLPI
jgi:hypothetical protein